MNVIEDIEIKESNNLEYSLKFILKEGSRTFSIYTNNKYDSNESRNYIRNGLDNWKEHFLGWTYIRDEKISADLDKPIKDYHVILKNGEQISIYDVVSYFKNLK